MMTNNLEYDNAYDGLSTYGQYAEMQVVNVSQNIWDVIAGQ